MPDTKEEVLKAAIAGLPRVVDAILAAPADAQSSMLAAVEDSYRKVARDLGYADSDVQNWVEQLMFRLRSEVTARRPPCSPWQSLTPSALGPFLPRGPLRWKI